MSSPIIIEKEPGKMESIQVIEGFNLSTDNLLKTILFAMWFYIMNSPVVSHILSRNLRNLIDINLVQTLIFALGFYILIQYI